MNARAIAMPDERRSRWIPWAFVAFFGVVLAANAAMVVIALASWPGLETQQAYQRGLAYDDALPGRRPAILMVHDRSGLNEKALEDTRMLARMGYVVLAADIPSIATMEAVDNAVMALGDRADVVNTDVPFGPKSLTIACIGKMGYGSA